MTIQVGVLGSRGRMGSEVVRAVEAAGDLKFVSGVDVGDDINELVADGAQVVVDFTTPTAVLDNVKFCIEHGIHAVIGTSGLTLEHHDSIRSLLGDSPRVGVLVAPNFGIAAVLMMKFSQIAAPYFESVEIMELHHPNKLDAPSGTARATAHMIAQAREAAGSAPMPDATVHSEPGARGAEIEGVRIHSARIRGMVAHQEVIFGDAGELLTIRHDSMNRESFMPGVILGIRKTPSRPGLTVGLEHLLDL